ncbi:MAG: serine hydrolase FSH [Monoraphidium minutum]|nr:MAG: serine hydrolase FSH [Monoraphidium minutum]
MQAPVGGRRRLRVLCLHSWRTSGAIFREQFERAKLLPAIDDLVELVFIDAPNAARGPPPKDVAGGFPGRPYYEWFTTEGAEENLSDFVLTYHGLEASEAHVERVIREAGPFDGLAGFSQGAIMASAMAAMQRAGTALAGAPPLRFVLLFGAAFSEHPRHQEAFFKNGRVEVPNVHVIGHKDFIRKHSVNLVRQFANPVVIFHPRGHVIPHLGGPQLAVLRAFLAAVATEAEGGGGGGAGPPLLASKL